MRILPSDAGAVRQKPPALQVPVEEGEGLAGVESAVRDERGTVQEAHDVLSLSVHRRAADNEERGQLQRVAPAGQAKVPEQTHQDPEAAGTERRRRSGHVSRL